jgi:hypothetical protein
LAFVGRFSSVLRAESSVQLGAVEKLKGSADLNAALSSENARKTYEKCPTNANLNAARSSSPFRRHASERMSLSSVRFVEFRKKDLLGYENGADFWMNR